MSPPRTAITGDSNIHPQLELDVPKLHTKFKRKCVFSKNSASPNDSILISLFILFFYHSTNG